METRSGPVNKSPMEQAYISIASGCVQAFGYQFDQQTDNLVTEMIRTGVSHLTGTDSGTKQSAQINLVLIISLMVREAESNEEYRSGLKDDEVKTVTKKDFFKIKALLCPLHPFWKEPCNQ